MRFIVRLHLTAVCVSASAFKHLLLEILPGTINSMQYCRCDCDAIFGRKPQRAGSRSITRRSICVTIILNPKRYPSTFPPRCFCCMWRSEWTPSYTTTAAVSHGRHYGPRVGALILTSRLIMPPDSPTPLALFSLACQRRPSLSSFLYM